MTRRRMPPSGQPGGPLPSLESRLDELQQQLDALTRDARTLRRQIDARKTGGRERQDRADGGDPET